MTDKYLLYIDILSFTKFVLNKGNVETLYDLIDSLNAHKHGSFKTIVFSDTILIYNLYNPKTAHDRHYLIMYLCEFAKDLLYRLIPRDIHFRAYLSKGEFKHKVLNNIEAFYGKALIHSYHRQPQIECIGLFIETPLLDDCDIFFTEPYDTQCHFVHLMQSLDSIRFEG